MSNIERLKAAQLEIAKEIKRVCEKYDIEYFLDAGSMLGAIRHGGFIPWDDDIDIGMTYENYKKFLKVAQNELGEHYFVDNYFSNNECPYVFTKVRMLGTEYVEKIGNSAAVHNEIFVDVFPYYYISDNNIVKRFEGLELALISQALLSKAGYKVWKGKGILKRLKFIPTDFLGILVRKNVLRRRIEWLINKHKSGEKMCIHSGSCYDYWYFPEYILRDLIDISFENVMFKTLKHYDYFLTVAYGNYLELPPEEKRTTHQIVKISFDR